MLEEKISAELAALQDKMEVLKKEVETYGNVSSRSLM